MTSAAPVNKRAPGDPPPWFVGLMTISFLTAVLWAVQIVNAFDNYGFDRYGLRPRTLDGLEGLITTPFLHSSYGHLASNTIPFVLLGWVALLGGLRRFVYASLFIMIVGGLLTWLAAPSGIIVGASALIFGWLGYLLARAFFERNIVHIAIAVLVAVIFGSLWSGLLPSAGSGVSWQGHLFGFLTGIIAGWILHPGKKSRRHPSRKAVAKTGNPA